MKKFAYILLIAIAAVVVTLIFSNRAIAPNEEDTQVEETGDTTVTIFLMAEQDSDPDELPYGTEEVQGCGLEYAVPLIESYEGEDTLENALNHMLSISTNEYKGYRNSFYMSDLTASVNEASNPVIINLEGQLMQIGTCDDPRLKAQMVKTVEYYLGNDEYEIQLNSSEAGWRCLGDESGLCS